MSNSDQTDRADPHAELKAWITRVEEIDHEIVMLAGEREALVNEIHRAGYPIGHKYRVRRVS